MLEKLADRVKRTLKPIEGCIVQQQAAMGRAAASSSTNTLTTGQRLVVSVRDGLVRSDDLAVLL